jgi:16S rRNA (guanine966-N2)-methyltransferase
VRIIAGKFKGVPLVDFKADHIRPTTDRVKETMFNILMGYFEDALVLDLFSGTGNLGLEALSRGAREVLFVESNKKSIEILKKNLAKLRVNEGYRINQRDVLQFLKNYEGEPFDVIFADPPFTEKMAHDVMLGASESKAFGPNTVLAIESSSKERMDEQYGNLVRTDVREFGDKILSFFRRAL